MTMKYITIVDDARDLGRVLQTLILTITKDLDISVVPSAEEALLYSGQHPIDLLVTDIRLPGISGPELVKKIRARHAGVKIIFITGLSDGPIVRQARELNAEFFFYKPMGFPDFLSAVRKCLDLPEAVSLQPELEHVPDPAASPSPAPAAAAAPAPAAMPQAPTNKTTVSRNEVSRSRPAEIIAGMRHDLGALAVFVLGENGHIIAQAGDLAKIDVEIDWAPTLFAALSSAEKVARLVKGQEASHVHGYLGKEFDLAMSSFGSLALLVILPKGQSGLRMALTFEEILTVEKDLGKIFGKIGVTVPKVEQAPEPVFEPELILEAEPGLEDLEKMITKSNAEIKSNEADDFWDSAQDTNRPPISSPDMITYEQAEKLGLAPEEGHEGH